MSAMGHEPSPTLTPGSRSVRFGRLVVALSAAHIAAAAVSNAAPLDLRPLVALCLIAILSMIAATFRMSRLTMIAGLVVGTILSLTVIFWWRRMLDPMAVLGPIPRSMELVAIGVFGIISIVLATIVTITFSDGSGMFRFRWIVFGATGMALVGFSVALFLWSQKANSPQALLQNIVMLEQVPQRSSWEEQQLATALSVLGRQHEARVIPCRPDAVGQQLAKAPDEAEPDSTFKATPWREVIARVALQQRLVVIMENHTISEHRAWIEQTLPLFREAGFNHYFAETIAEPGSSLKSRGYPTWKTGAYTIDPRFGNLVRTAIHLDFEIGGYDLLSSDFNARESYQAATLAAKFAAHPNCKMVVHCGHAHVMKYEDRVAGQYMAAKLWKATGIEPFTIWQLSNELPNDVYGPLIRQLGPIKEPVMLAPAPTDLTEKLLPTSSVQPAVDAVVIHPPEIGQEPTNRGGAFAEEMVRISGEWLGRQWPVTISAMATGEPDNAVPLDQVMLRSGESNFELWVPHNKYTLRVWGLNGPLRIDADTTSSQVRVDLRP